MTGAQIKALRKALGLTPKDLADRVGLTGEFREITVYAWESDRRNPSAQSLSLLKSLRDSTKKRKKVAR